MRTTKPQAGDGGDPATGRAAGADGRGVAAALRLDQRTHLDGGRYRVVLRNYGDGLGEIGWSFIPSRGAIKAGRGESEHRNQNRDRAMRRARSRLRQLILATKADHRVLLAISNLISPFVYRYVQASVKESRKVNAVVALSDLASKLQCGSAGSTQGKHARRRIQASEKFMLLKNTFHASNKYRGRERTLEHLFTHLEQTVRAIPFCSINVNNVAESRILSWKKFFEIPALIQPHRMGILNAQVGANRPNHGSYSRMAAPYD